VCFASVVRGQEALAARIRNGARGSWLVGEILRLARLEGKPQPMVASAVARKMPRSTATDGSASRY